MWITFYKVNVNPQEIRKIDATRSFIPFRSLYIFKFEMLFGLKENFYFINLKFISFLIPLNIKEWPIYCLPKLTPINLKFIHRFKLWRFRSIQAQRGWIMSFWDLKQCIWVNIYERLQVITPLHLEDSGSRSLRIFGKHLSKFKALYPRTS
jgi:hypothetical protein